MRRFISFSLAALLLAALGAVQGSAQTSQSYPQRFYYASDFGQWQIPGQTANSYLWSPGSICLTGGTGTAPSFMPFATTAPVEIVDATAANDEVVTPSAVSNTATQCSITVTPSNSHYSFSVISGTGGLQEAINQTKDQAAWPSLILLDRNWWTKANAVVGTSGSTILGAATGDATAMLEDITTLGPTYYVWSGTAYTTGTWSNAAPTLAAGAAAGTSPTVSNAASSTALIGTANVTAGTATTTGTLFTETWATSAQFLYSGSCSVTSIGTNSFTAFTVATAYTSSHRVLTVTATSAPTASTAYVFRYSCK